MWRLVGLHQWPFFAVWQSFDWFWRLVDCRYSLGRRDDWYTNGYFCCFDCLLTVFDKIYGTLYQSLKTLKTIGVQIVSGLPRLYQQCTRVYQSSKTVKRQSNSKKWPLVHKSSQSTQSPPNTQSRANAATLRNLHHMCLGSGDSPLPVIRVDCMCLHGRPCVWLPFAAACGYTLFYQLMMPAARLVCQRPSSNFPYFRTSFANFLLSRPNSVEYGNSKATTLLPSAKCTRPLFQGRTGCDGRPSGWHDIVTCQHLVYNTMWTSEATFLFIVAWTLFMMHYLINITSRLADHREHWIPRFLHTPKSLEFLACRVSVNAKSYLHSRVI